MTSVIILHKKLWRNEFWCQTCEAVVVFMWLLICNRKFFYGILLKQRNDFIQDIKVSALSDFRMTSFKVVLRRQSFFEYASKKKWDRQTNKVTNKKDKKRLFERTSASFSSSLETLTPSQRSHKGLLIM